MPQYQGIWTLAQAAQLQSTQQWATDPLFENTTLLLQADNAANGAQNNTFLDSSSNNFTITRNGNTTQGTFTPFSQSPGWWSNYFPGGNGKYIYAPYNAAFDFGTNDFSVECFAYVTDAGRSADANKYGVFVSGGNTNSLVNLWGFSFGISGGVINQVFFDAAGSTVLTAASQSISLNAWHHFVVCRTGTALSIYVDGTRVATTTYSSAVNTNSSGAVLISQSAFQNVYENWLIGNISNVRIIKGTQPYNAANSSITVPTAQLTNITNTSLLTCLSNRFIDTGTANGGNPFTITIVGTGMSVQAFSPFAPQYQYTPSVTGGSGYFDGSGDFLQTATTTAFAFGTNNFTIEGWVYLTAYNSGACLFGTTQGATTGYYVNLGGDINSLRVTSNASGTWADNITVSAGNGVRLNEWTHIALVRNAGSLILYKNGVNVASTSSAASWNFTSPNNAGYIGRVTNGVSTQDLAGWVTSVRVSNTARSISVPTTPYSSDANTSLLLNFTNAGIYDGTLKNNLETVGNAQISTSVVKYGTGSMYFDGTGDYLVSNPATTDLYAFGTGDFTIEMWVYFNGVASIQCLYDSRPNATQGAYPLIYLNSDGTIRYFVSSADRITSSAVIASTWYHLAVVRLNGSTKMYINGVQSGSTYTDSTAYLNTSGRPWIGVNAFNGTQGLNGYIDDLRITKGVARYTANFTPPRVALPRQ